MRSKFWKPLYISAAVFVGMSVGVNAAAQELVTEQTLGTVNAVAPDRVLEMTVNDPNRLVDFETEFEDPQNRTDYVSCARVPNDGYWGRGFDSGLGVTLSDGFGCGAVTDSAAPDSAAPRHTPDARC